MNARRIYRFAGCTVDPQLRQVYCRGILAEPQPKAFDLLLYLIEHRDRVVEKDELLEALWPGTIVSESALTQATRKARSMVGDDGARQCVIHTVPRRGFRFVAELEPEESAPDSNARQGRASRTGHQGESSSPSVAVLPFADMSPQRDQEYFCDGMAEEVINEIARIPGLQVAARTSTFKFKHCNEDVREIARELGVVFVLEGSVRRAGNQLRVTAQLIDARSGFHLWSQRWDDSLEDMFAIQEQIAQGIADALREHGDNRGRTAAPVSAAELYRRGLVYRNRGGGRSQRFAIELFRQALALDSTFVRAWAGLAIAYWLLHFYTSEDESLERAREAVAKAIELDSNSPDVLTADGAVAALRHDYAHAETAFERALALAPDLFEANFCYGRACAEAGWYERAAALFERAATLAPNDYEALCFAAQAYRSLGRENDALDALRRQLLATERALAIDPLDARALSLSAGAMADMGRIDEARARIERSCQLEPAEGYVHYNAACLYARLGEIDRALDTLERHASTCQAQWALHDSDLESIHDHPRFKALTRHIFDPSG